MENRLLRAVDGKATSKLRNILALAGHYDSVSILHFLTSLLALHSEKLNAHSSAAKERN